MKINYSEMTEAVIKEAAEKGEKPSLLLHVCCAPCSSYVLEYLNNYDYLAESVEKYKNI